MRRLVLGFPGATHYDPLAAGVAPTLGDRVDVLWPLQFCAERTERARNCFVYAQCHGSLVFQFTGTRQDGRHAGGGRFGGILQRLSWAVLQSRLKCA